jgi:dTDP-3-amino-3,4,6-trideoxy-alpha-D-glucose transaminase
MTDVVPVVDMARRAALLGSDVVADVSRVMLSGSLLLGPELAGFESEFGDWLGARHVAGVASGTDALRLVMVACGVGVGDEVIVPALTAVPTAAAVCAVGATPVIVDVNDDDALISVEAVSRAVTDRTKAIVPVHLYGRPADVAALATLGIPIFEDAAQAHGALHGPRPSVATGYSFYPTKNLGTIGDGGAVVTEDAELDAKIRRLRFHGQTELYHHVDIATNSRMSEIESVYLRHQLRQLDAQNERRRAIARSYRAAAPTLRWPSDHPDHVYHLCVVRVANRDVFRKELLARGVNTAVHYPLSVNQQPAYQQFSLDPCLNAQAWAAECVTLPCAPELTDDEVARVTSALIEVADLACAK